MFSLVQSKRVRGSAGEPIESPFKSLESKDIRFVRGQLVLVAAGPGTGKSAFTLTLALKSRRPTVYFSADSDPFVQLSRAISVSTGWSIEKSSNAVRDDNIDEDAIRELRNAPIRFDYKANPSPDSIELTLKAYDEVYGDFPELVIVDNVTNVVGLSMYDDDPFAGLEGLMDYLADMARKTQACVVGLHHVTGAYNNGDIPIPLSGIKGQIARVPGMVLTAYKESDHPDLGVRLMVAGVKNRNGFADSTGTSGVPLAFDGERMQITDIEYEGLD